MSEEEIAFCAGFMIVDRWWEENEGFGGYTEKKALTRARKQYRIWRRTGRFRACSRRRRYYHMSSEHIVNLSEH